ncbi:ANKRD17 [Mytilus edulis]|uniref:ANKRD17 n=1 Tax=Mytilus edulis TaxID=6550 RepID=A0A8S3UR21_MYTED|nr:ANKRD17 [Mytilus edulis]
MDQNRTKTSAPLKKGKVTKARHDILINKPMDTGITPLMAAAFKGYVDVVTYLLDIKVAVDNADDNKSTALHYACINNHAEIVRLLLRYGAKVDPFDQWHQTPFHISCTYGHIDIIKLLLFCDEPITSSIGSKKRISLSSDNPSICDPFSHQNLHINKSVDLTDMDIEGDTALHAACYNEHIEVGKLLLKVGINVNEVNSKGQTPLLVACANGFFNIAQFLIDKKACINQSDNDKFTPLFYASQGNPDIVELLIEHK